MKSWGSSKCIVIALILVLIFQLKTAAQYAASAGISKKSKCVNAGPALLVPSLLIGTGLATMYDRGWYSSYDAQEHLREKYPEFQCNIENYLMFMPAAGVYGLNVAGIEGWNSFTDRTIIYLVSLGLTMATTAILKSGTGVERPDGSDFRSFPSNHAAIAFASATFLFEEYKATSIWYGIAGYSVATLTGVLRMMNNRHWMSDVLVGAGFGILWTKALYLFYPAIKNSVPTGYGRGSRINLTVMPSLSPGGCGILVRYHF
jgi:membrane-associated phospholipid phosphatase